MGSTLGHLCQEMGMMGADHLRNCSLHRARAIRGQVFACPSKPQMEPFILRKKGDRRRVGLGDGNRGKERKKFNCFPQKNQVWVPVLL